MLNAFLPKGAPFFELLLQQNAIMCSVCALVPDMLDAEEPGGQDLHNQAARLEEEGDALYATIIRALSQTFITPIDREDILAIAKEQEYMTDLAQNLMARLYIFDIAAPPFPLRELAHNLQEMALLSSSMLRGLAARKDSHNTKAFRALRNKSEMLISSGLGEVLDDTQMTPQAVLATLKLSRAFDRMEQAMDQITDLVEAIEEAVLKNV
ncbi:DUF47 family protein [Desulfovibrio sp. OttesenSCG-928-C14]|nr:DUF47 family protein [Desulfovibrio sp. OttesenSCG-928-C14]